MLIANFSPRMYPKIARNSFRTPQSTHKRHFIPIHPYLSHLISDKNKKKQRKRCLWLTFSEALFLQSHFSLILTPLLPPPNPTSFTSPLQNPPPPYPLCQSLTFLLQRAGPHTHGCPRKPSSSRTTRTRKSSGWFSTPSSPSLPSCSPARPATSRSGWLRPHWVRPFCFKVVTVPRASRSSVPITSETLSGFCCKWVSSSPTGHKYLSLRFGPVLSLCLSFLFWVFFVRWFGWVFRCYLHALRFLEFECVFVVCRGLGMRFVRSFEC